MADAQVQVTPADPWATGAAMRQAGLEAPLPCDTPEQIAANGECFELQTESGRCAFVLRRRGEVLWIDGAGALTGQGFTQRGLELCKEIARQAGCSMLAFETNRRGLVRMSARQGFEVAGFVMKVKI